MCHCACYSTIIISSNDPQQNENRRFFLWNKHWKTFDLKKLLLPIFWNNWIISVFLKVTNNSQKGQNVSLFNHLVYNIMDCHLTFIFLADCVPGDQHNSTKIVRCIGRELTIYNISLPSYSQMFNHPSLLINFSYYRLNRFTCECSGKNLTHLNEHNNVIKNLLLYHPKIVLLFQKDIFSRYLGNGSG